MNWWSVALVSATDHITKIAGFFIKILITFVLLKTKNMKKILVLFFSLVVFFYFSGKALAQEKPTVAVASMKHNGKNVEVTLTSSKPFIFGNNRYILYIGETEFLLNKQWHLNGRGTMVFYVPVEEFKSIKEGAGIYLTYGHLYKDTKPDMQALSAQSRKCWSLGVYSKKLLTK
jgi:hypothetical protein